MHEKWYPFFFKIARIWAKSVLFFMGFRYKVNFEQTLEQNTSYMLVSNHTSMMDIMLMLAIVKSPFVFVGKKELGKIPLFGYFYRRTCILVDRSSVESKKAVFEQAQKKLRRGYGICIFPEGGVPDESVFLDEFKDGAFRLAIEHQIPIVPITFPDNKAHFSFTFMSGKPGLLRVFVHPFFSTIGLELSDKKRLKEEVRTLIIQQLKVHMIE